MLAKTQQKISLPVEIECSNLVIILGTTDHVEFYMILNRFQEKEQNVKKHNKWKLFSFPYCGFPF
jgi:hypothetical protein